jgi:hypothetical protein
LQAVYGKLNIVEMHGLVRLAAHEPLEPPSPTLAPDSAESSESEVDDDEYFSDYGGGAY